MLNLSLSTLYIALTFISFKSLGEGLNHDNHAKFVIAEGEGLFDLALDRFNYELYKKNRVADRDDSFHLPHFQAITKDVTSIDGSKSWSSKIGLFGEQTFPIATDDNGNVLIAAALFGKGRVFFSGHEGYVLNGQPNPGLLKLTQNAVQWLAQADKLDGIILKSWSTAVGNLPAKAIGVSVQKLDPGTQVYYVPLRNTFSDDDIKKLLDYVRNGGGLMVSGQVWSWLSSNGGEENAINNSGNRLIKAFGAIMGSNIGSAKALESSLEKNILYALRSLSAIQSSTSDVILRTLGETGKLVMNVKTSKDVDFQNVFQQAELTYKGYPSSADKAVFCRLTAALLPLILLKKPTSIPVASDFKTFPGVVPLDAQRVTETFNINGSYPGYPGGFWYSQAGKPLMVSTGLYAAPGEFIKVTLDPQFQSTLQEDHGIDIQIGVHSDLVYHKPEARRSPQIVTYNKITLEAFSVAANPWGGLIYVRVRHGSKLPFFKITIENAVRAPYFALGKHSIDEWRSTIRNYPAPWGELETPNQVILSVPSSVLRDYQDPVDLLTMYKKVMQEYNFLQGFEGDYRFRAERMALDAEISGGWMHSGYPVMAYQSIAQRLIDPNSARGWGELHEFGHNAQWSGYTTDDTTESGCNVYANYVSINLLNATTRYNQRNDDAQIVNWLLEGRTTYTGHIAASSYNTLMVRYGYENWRNMNRFYFQNPQEVKGGKYDIFAYVMAKVMGMNVCPYFEFFTYKLTNRTLETCKALPNMPDLIIDRYAPVTKDVPSPIGTCPQGWIQHGANCFYFENKQSLKWDETEIACQAINSNAHLASCLSADEAFFLTKHMRDNNLGGMYHIGISEQNDENVPKFLDGSKLPSLMPWKYDYPKKDSNRCTKMEGGFLYDENCDKKAGFICKQGPTSCTSKIACPSGWIMFFEHCYWVFYGGVNYSVAKADCISKQSYLLEINSKDENDFFDKLVKRIRTSGQYYYRNYWLGMEDTTKWNSGEPLEFENWCPGTNLTLTYGAVAAKATSYCWSPLRPTQNEAYICEKQAIAIP